MLNNIFIPIIEAADHQRAADAMSCRLVWLPEGSRSGP